MLSGQCLLLATQSVWENFGYFLHFAPVCWWHSINSSSVVVATMNNSCTTVINHKNCRPHTINDDKKKTKAKIFFLFRFGILIDYGCWFSALRIEKLHYFTNLDVGYRNTSIELIWLFCLVFMLLENGKFWHLIRTTVNHKLKNHLFPNSWYCCWIADFPNTQRAFFRYHPHQFSTHFQWNFHSFSVRFDGYLK